MADPRASGVGFPSDLGDERVREDYELNDVSRTSFPAPSPYSYKGDQDEQFLLHPESTKNDGSHR